MLCIYTTPPFLFLIYIHLSHETVPWFINFLLFLLFTILLLYLREEKGEEEVVKQN